MIRPTHAERHPARAVALPAPDLPTPPPLTDAERADAQRWALSLSQMADPEARQSRLATAPAHGQPAIRHDLAWRRGGPHAETPNRRPGQCRRWSDNASVAWNR